MRASRDPMMRPSWLVVDEPVYVVEFAATSINGPERWRLMDVEDVVEVLDWVGRHQHDRAAAISIEIADDLGLTLVRLTSPTLSMLVG